MRRALTGTCAALVAILVAAWSLRASPSTNQGGLPLLPSAQALAASLPEELQGDAKVVLDVSAGNTRGAAFGKLLLDARAGDFMLAVMLVEPSDEKYFIIQNLRFLPHFRVNPHTLRVLESIVDTSSDSRMLAEAITALQVIPMWEMREAMDQRIARAGDPPDWLLEEQERWMLSGHGVALPRFMRTPPPPFAVPVQRDRVRVLAFGDFGAEGSNHQAGVATAMGAVHQRTPFDLGITLGDNFYPRGLPTPLDPRWETLFERHYGALGIPIHAVLGNHDWYDSDSPASEIAYTSRSRAWRLPAQYYTFTAGPAQFFAIDTNDLPEGAAMSERQLRWLRQALDDSRARWKIVYGHVPIYVASANRDRIDVLVDRLLPVLEGRADLYVAGHYHSLQHLKPTRGLNFLVSAGGGASLYRTSSSDPRALFALSEAGFCVLDIDERAIDVRFIGLEARELYRAEIAK